MKKALLILMMMAVCGNAFAQVEKIPVDEKPAVEKAVCYYVYIDRQSPETNDVQGQNEKGDVIDVIPCAKIKPPAWDFTNFDIIKMSLTPTEADELKESLLAEDASEENGWEVEKERKNKIDVSTLQKATPSGLGDEFYEKTDIEENITVKSATVVAVER